MTNQALKLEDFRRKKRSKNQQKTLLRGDGSGPPGDTIRGIENGNL